MKNLRVRITLTEGILGMSPNDRDIYTEYIASKSPDASTIEDEVSAVGVDEVVNKQMTVFPRDKDGIPFIYDYQMKGFFKDACGMLSRVKIDEEPEEDEDGKKKKGKKKKALTESAKITAYKKVIDGLIFVTPRKIKFNFEGEIGYCQRPLRASTPQGERIALANSEEIPEGATIEFTVKLLSDEYEKAVIEWLDYGALRGLGQWRNSGKGRFEYEILDEKGSKNLKTIAVD